MIPTSSDNRGCIIRVHMTSNVLPMNGGCCHYSAQVDFDDGTQNTTTEECVYPVSEPLPRKIKEKLKVVCVCVCVYIYIFIDL